MLRVQLPSPALNRSSDRKEPPPDHRKEQAAKRYNRTSYYNAIPAAVRKHSTCQPNTVRLLWIGPSPATCHSRSKPRRVGRPSGRNCAASGIGSVAGSHARPATPAPPTCAKPAASKWPRCSLATGLNARHLRRGGSCKDTPDR